MAGSGSGARRYGCMHLQAKGEFDTVQNVFVFRGDGRLRAACTCMPYARSAGADAACTKTASIMPGSSEAHGLREVSKMT
eukprot:scaffold32288_cov101-Isochrysis_galbana.AAC.1